MQQIKLLRIEDIAIKTTLAKSTIWRKIANGEFIKPKKLGSSNINVWKESEVDDWIEEQFNSKGESND